MSFMNMEIAQSKQMELIIERKQYCISNTKADSEVERWV